ncbi:MAG: Hsp20/alpha crystallin family protein [Fibrobacter sp.]|nr:Hsp20/alpha crystallin family protein [Fibrobacter sp.]
MYNTQMIPTHFFGLDKFFDAFENEGKACGSCMPRAAVAENNGQYTLEVDLPGVKKEDIDLNLENFMLTIKASRKSATADMKFERSFKLSQDLDTEAADVTFENGLLSIKLSKKASAAPHKLVIK